MKRFFVVLTLVLSFAFAQQVDLPNPNNQNAVICGLMEIITERTIPNTDVQYSMFTTNDAEEYYMFLFENINGGAMRVLDTTPSEFGTLTTYISPSSRLTHMVYNDDRIDLQCHYHLVTGFGN